MVLELWNATYGSRDKARLARAEWEATPLHVSKLEQTQTIGSDNPPAKRVRFDKQRNDISRALQMKRAAAMMLRVHALMGFGLFRPLKM